MKGMPLWSEEVRSSYTHQLSTRSKRLGDAVIYLSTHPSLSSQFEPDLTQAVPALMWGRRGLLRALSFKVRPSTVAARVLIFPAEILAVAVDQAPRVLDQ
ncbi:unnamed protein product [Euphydryas editha]|uniref:Uncharacterized protein n=1 Tax=Euphydryas editha TaxID=104508 RepID=A0AAU9TC78_EUPED|nr:unnamed protein product [Euphydryas editha]